MAKQDDFARITLRIPPDMHRQLTERLSAGISMNGDILRRLAESLEADTIEVLEAALKTEPPYWTEIRLNASGGPISWDEIQAHVGAITDAIDKPVVALNIEVVTPEVVSSWDRIEQAGHLQDSYARHRKILRARNKGEH